MAGCRSCILDNLCSRRRLVRPSGIDGLLHIGIYDGLRASLFLEVPSGILGTWIVFLSTLLHNGDIPLIHLLS